MANSKFEAEVVRYLRKKTNGDYTEAPTYLGSEQKFVGALRNSSDNNLEEQFLLGTDCLTTSWMDDGNNIHIRKEYYIQDTGDDDSQKLSSYVIDSIIYDKDALYNKDIFFIDDRLIADNIPDISFNSEILLLDNDVLYHYAADSLNIYPNAFVVTREDKLQFVDGSNTLIDVLTKYTGKKYSEDGKFLYTQEKIVNHLK